LEHDWNTEYRQVTLPLISTTNRGCWGSFERIWMQLQFELPHFLGKFRLKWFGIHASDRAHMMTGTVLNSGRSARRNTSLSTRHQIGVLQRSARKRPKLILLDRLLWAALSRVWSEWRSALAIVQPETVVAWHRRGFRLFWAWKIRRGHSGRPRLPCEVRDLIRRMCRENPTWGAPRIHGELLNSGSTLGKQRQQIHGHAAVSRRRRLGVPFWTIMPSSWSPSISSPARFTKIINKTNAISISMEFACPDFRPGLPKVQPSGR
jgi:hypothetical protein